MSRRLYRNMLLACLTIHTVTQAQESRYNPYSKGRAYLYWGWNRGIYTKSTLTLNGPDYHLKLHKVRAADRPTHFNVKDYLAVTRMTIPQNNWRIGYFVKDDLAISFGTDHMKYVMAQNQTVRVDGTIGREGNYKGVYNHQPTVLAEDFLTFEHTDGLNYVNVELEKYNRVAATANEKVIFNAMFGGGAGFMFPKTNAKLLDYERNDRFHISGFGLNAKLALEAVLFKRMFIRFEAKEGYINMPNIILHGKGIEGKGKQTFFFTEFDGVLGWNFMAHKPRNKKANKG